MSTARILRVLPAVLMALWIIGCNDDNGVQPPPLPEPISLQLYNTSNGLPNNDVFDIFVDSQDRIWFATDKGLGLLDNGVMTLIDQADGLVHPNTRSVAEFNGKIYVGTWGGGMAVYDGAVWGKMTTVDGLIDNTIFRIVTDETSLWIASVKGVSNYDPASGIIIRYGAELPRPKWKPNDKYLLRNPETSAVVPLDTPRGREIWFGAKYGNITVWRPTADSYFRYAPTNSGLPASYINDICFNPVDGKYWVAMATAGIASVDVPNSSWTHFEQQDGLPSAVVHSIAADQSGRIWVGTNQGLAKQDGSRFKGYARASGLPVDRVRRVYVDPQNRVWLGFVEGGAARVLP